MIRSGSGTGQTQGWVWRISSSRLQPRTCTNSWRRPLGISLHSVSRLVSICHSLSLSLFLYPPSLLSVSHCSYLFFLSLTLYLFSRPISTWAPLFAHLIPMLDNKPILLFSMINDLCACRWWPGSVQLLGLLVLVPMNTLLVWGICSVWYSCCLTPFFLSFGMTHTSPKLCPSADQAYPILVWVPRLATAVLDSCKYPGGGWCWMWEGNIVIVGRVQ